VTTELIDDRELALATGYKATDWSQSISFDEYKNLLRDWDVKAVVRDGECVGAVYFNDGEVHASILPEWRKKWLTRKILKTMFAHERARTRVTPGHEYMHDILRRLGLIPDNNGFFVKGY
jgi:hypothetical protein